MERIALGIALAVVMLGGVSRAHGQQATERFIPLGQSPGISGRLTAIGTIESVDAERRSVRLTGPAGSIDVQIQDTTRIWIDRHALGLSTLDGSFADLRPGTTAEVKYADPQARSVAEWVKLQPRDAGP